MIRRQQDGDLLLITQHDHALLAGELASHVGNEQFSAPKPYEQTVTGVRLHDCGWPTHDDSPTINASGQPLDVFETPREIALKAWTTSADRAAEKDPYAGLLTSLHILALSVMALDAANAHESWNIDDPTARFEIVRFQQRQIEHQERLRQRLGLRTEKPTATKQPKESLQRSEDQLQSNFRLLQVMDLLSLGLCCTEPPFKQTMELPMRPGGEGRKLTIHRERNDLRVTPWPFNEQTLDVQVPVCRIADREYSSDADLQQAFAAGTAEILGARVLPG